MEQTIGIKQLYTDMKKIYRGVQKGQSFVVIKNSTPVFRIEPIQKSAGKKYTMDDMHTLQFRGKKNTSKDIDHVIYSV